MSKSIALLFFAFAGIGIAQSADPFPKSRGGCRYSVVQIRQNFTDKTTETGTGFFVNEDGYLITAAHVIKTPPGKTREGIFASLSVPVTKQGGVTMSGTLTGSAVRVVAEDDEHDIAILLPARNPFKNPYSSGVVVNGKPLGTTTVRFSQLDMRTPRAGEQVFTIGFPLFNRILITTSGRIASADAYSSADSPTHAIDDLYLADIHVNPGNSGGPALSPDRPGAIGIVVQYQSAPVHFSDGSPSNAYGVSPGPNNTMTARELAANSGLAVIVPAKYIAELLTANKIKFSGF